MLSGTDETPTLNIWRINVQRRIQRIDRRIPVERAAAGEQLVEDAAEREQIGTMIDRLARRVSQAMEPVVPLRGMEL